MKNLPAGPDEGFSPKSPCTDPAVECTVQTARHAPTSELQRADSGTWHVLHGPALAVQSWKACEEDWTGLFGIRHSHGLQPHAKHITLNLPPSRVQHPQPVEKVV